MTTLTLNEQISDYTVNVTVLPECFDAFQNIFDTHKTNDAVFMYLRDGSFASLKFQPSRAGWRSAISYIKLVWAMCSDVAITRTLFGIMAKLSVPGTYSIYKAVLTAEPCYHKNELDVMIVMRKQLCFRDALALVSATDSPTGTNGNDGIVIVRDDDEWIMCVKASYSLKPVAAYRTSPNHSYWNDKRLDPDFYHSRIEKVTGCTTSTMEVENAVGVPLANFPCPAVLAQWLDEVEQGSRVDFLPIPPAELEPLSQPGPYRVHIDGYKLLVCDVAVLLTGCKSVKSLYSDNENDGVLLYMDDLKEVKKLKTRCPSSWTISITDAYAQEVL